MTATAAVDEPVGDVGNALALSTYPQAGRPSGLSSPFNGFLDDAAIGLVASETLRPMENGVCAVAILMHANLGSDEVRTKPAGWDLQPQPLESHGVVIADNTLLLNA